MPQETNLEYISGTPLASSALSTLVRARRASDGANVILKQWNQGDREQQKAVLERELSLLARLDSPFTLNPIGLMSVDERPALLLEGFEGRSLAPVQGKTEIADLIQIAMATTQALSHAHEHGSVHRDVNPSNLLFEPDSRQLKLVNFNLDHSGTAATNVAPASLPYLPPECSGRMNRLADYRADYYSLGVTLYHLACGRLPFEASDALGWVHAHLSKQPRLLSEADPRIPETLALIVGKLLAKDPEARYQSSYGLLWDLNLCSRAWTTGRDIPVFQIAERDVSPRLKTGETFAGRSTELSACASLIPELSEPGSHFLCISGSTGVGKSALLASFTSLALSTPCYVLQAAFDPEAQNRPYSAIVSAANGLVDQLLAEPEEKLAMWRARLVASLGETLAVLIDFSPRLTQVVGAQPTPVPLAPSEARYRLVHALREFLELLASPERPVVFALDDCQWMDASSADLLAQVFTGPTLNHLLLVLAFRREAIAGTTPLSSLLKAVRSIPKNEIVRSALRELSLSNLDLGGNVELLQAALCRKAEDLFELAEAVIAKTDGNPLFTWKLLEQLHRRGALRLDADRGIWVWNLDAVKSCEVSDNVATSMVLQLKELEPRVLEVLGAAACIGQHFDTAAISRASSQPQSEVLDALLHAAAHDLVRSLEQDRLSTGPEGPAKFVFVHGRVRDAAYALLSTTQRDVFHESYGRALLASDDGSNSDRLFDVLYHLNHARHRLDSPDARLELAEENLVATRRSLSKAAFALARSYSEIALELLVGCDSALADELFISAKFANAEAVYLTGDFDKALNICSDLLDLADERLSQARVHSLKARIYDHMAQFAESISELRLGLALFDVNIPTAFSEIDAMIGPGIGKMEGHLATRSIEALAELEITTNPDTAMIHELLAQIVAPAIQSYPPLFIVADLLMFDLALTQGISATSCKNFVDCGILQAALLGKLDAAYRMGKVALQLLDRFAPTPLEAGVQFVFAAYVSHWKSNLSEGDAAFVAAKRRGAQLGDVSHMAYGFLLHMHRQLQAGRPLDHCESALAEAEEVLVGGKYAGPMVGILSVVRTLDHLRAPAGSEQTVMQADQEAVATVVASKNAQWGYSFGELLMMVSVIERDLAKAKEWLTFTQPFLPAAMSLFSIADYHLLSGLIAASDYRMAEDSERAPLLQSIDNALSKLQSFSECAPQNFEHKAELLSAERARALGQPLADVLSGYQRCIRAAGDSFPHYRALAHELEAELWLELGDSHHARPALRAAYRLYSAWGATAKLRKLESQYPWMRRRNVSEPAPSTANTARLAAVAGGLDSSSIIKATQAISSEVEPVRLFSTLMTTLIESAGAQLGCLVLESELDGDYYVEARAHVDGPVSCCGAERLEGAPLVCANAVRYVLRAQRALVLDNAMADSTFKTDPYVISHGVRSLLCVPIQRQGRSLGALYLENNQTTHAFTQERIGILHVIASQAAISIYNSQLYSSLEQRVKDRTQELARKNRQIASMLDSMEQGVFTIDSNIRVQLGYSKHLEQILATRDVAGRDCVELLFSQTSLSPDALLASENALRFSFGVEYWLAEVNTKEHLIRSFEQAGQDGHSRFFEVDWNFICDDADIVERILVVVRDVSVLRQLQETAATRREEADIISQILETGLDAFYDFKNSASDVLRHNRALIGSSLLRDPSVLASSFRQLHTLKGNARLCGYSSIVDAIHSAENTYDGLRKNPHTSINHEQLGSVLQELARVLENYEQVCSRKLAALSRGHDRRSEQALQRIERLIARNPASQDSADVLLAVQSILLTAEGTPLADIVTAAAALVPELARELGRPVPVLQSVGGANVFAKDWARLVRDILVQCLRNSLYHGLENEALRLERCKPIQGTIYVEASMEQSAFSILVRDDGQGLALGALRSRPAYSQLTDEELADTIFASGVSTAEEVGLIAGRGVGLDIVRAELRARGGDARLLFTGPAVADLRPFALLLLFPKDAVLGLEIAEDKLQSPQAAE